jgi:hypothetical protein
LARIAGVRHIQSKEMIAMSPRASIPRLAALALGSLLLCGAAASSAGAGSGLPDPFSPNFTDELLDYSNRLAAESRSWFEPPPGPPPVHHNPYAEFGAAMVQRMREQDAVFEACAAGNQRACASRQAVLDEIRRETRGLATITGIEGAYDYQRELGAEWRRKELYRHSPEWGYSASDLLR